jgi:type I restriction enzyme M protein
MPKRHRPGVSAPSVLRHIEEIVLATSGEDAFEVVFGVAAARIDAATKRSDCDRAPGSARRIREVVAAVRKRHPILEIDLARDVSDDLLTRVDSLLARALPDGDDGLGPSARYATLDAVFESLVPRVAKGDKGQFFTPRHVVEFVIQMLSPTARDVIVDPACGSGAFLAHARAHADVRAHGSDVDARAVRVARLLALAAGADPAAIVRGDGLRKGAEGGLPRADIVATNPPFAGRASSEGFELARVVRTPERDVLFVERALDLLRPGGRLGIVLPYNKASGEAYAAMRRWLVERARVLAVVGLPRETFLPHTSQRTFVLFAQKRDRTCTLAAARDERTMLVVSERAGKDTGGEPIMKGGRLDHDLDAVAAELGPFLQAEGRASWSPTGGFAPQSPRRKARSS